MGAELVVTVHGIPAPQGSKRHVGDGRMVEVSKRLPVWREAVRHEAVRACQGANWIPPQAAWVQVVFTLPRPRIHYGTGKHSDRIKPSAPEYPTGRPDLDKLVRATHDALTDGGALTDDARVIRLQAEKSYPGMHWDALDTPGAVIIIRGLP